MNDIEQRALGVAAEKSGLSEEEVARAVLAYRRAAERLHDEPEWTLICTMSGQEFGCAQYGAEATKVTLQVDSWKSRGKWESETRYIFAGTPYETFGEARETELRDQGADQTNVARLVPASAETPEFR